MAVTAGDLQTACTNVVPTSGGSLQNQETFWESAQRIVTVVCDRLGEFFTKVFEIVSQVFEEISAVAQAHPKEFFVALGVATLIGILIGTIFSSRASPQTT